MMKQVSVNRKSIDRPVDHFHEIIGKRLHKLRKSKGYTIKGVAAELKMTPATIGRIEKGIHQNFKIGWLKSLCDFYEADPLAIVNTKGKWDIETTITNNKTRTDS